MSIAFFARLLTTPAARYAALAAAIGWLIWSRSEWQAEARAAEKSLSAAQAQIADMQKSALIAQEELQARAARRATTETLKQEVRRAPVETDGPIAGVLRSVRLHQNSDGVRQTPDTGDAENMPHRP